MVNVFLIARIIVAIGIVMMVAGLCLYLDSESEDDVQWYTFAFFLVGSLLALPACCFVSEINPPDCFKVIE